MTGASCTLQSAGVTGMWKYTGASFNLTRLGTSRSKKKRLVGIYSISEGLVSPWLCVSVDLGAVIAHLWFRSGDNGEFIQGRYQLSVLLTLKSVQITKVKEIFSRSDHFFFSKDALALHR